MATEIETRDVDVTDFPVDVLKQLQQMARANGVNFTPPAAVRWAAVQFAKSMAAPGKHGDST